MKFSEHINQSQYNIVAYDDKSISVNNETIEKTLLISPNHMIKKWKEEPFSSLEPEDLKQIFQLEPEVILFGTGVRQQLPSKQVLQSLSQYGVGFEVMTTSAACRTFNILATEDRNVVAGLFIE